MANYYFLTAYLPPLSFDGDILISFEELLPTLEANLTKQDLEKVAVLRRYIDLKNILAYLSSGNHDMRGNLTAHQIEEAFLLGEGFPSYLTQFLETYEDDKARLKYFPKVFVDFFNYEVKGQSGFLKKYLTFEREYRLVLVAIRARGLKRDLPHELRYEDPEDLLVEQLLQNKDQPDFQVPDEYEDLYKLIGDIDDPLKVCEFFEQYRFNKLESMFEKGFFSIDWVLSYLARLLLLEKFRALDEKVGLSRFNDMKK